MRAHGRDRIVDVGGLVHADLGVERAQKKCHALAHEAVIVNQQDSHQPFPFISALFSQARNCGSSTLVVQARGNSSFRGIDIPRGLRRHRALQDRRAQVGRDLDCLVGFQRSGHQHLVDLHAHFARHRLEAAQPQAQGTRTEPLEIGRAVQQECRDRSRMPSSA
eukprot:TRINITY_DN5495_c0_g1_i2.p1 TRINITY_DN5495_c0_g1~~TRINITY_DN5495_c0_g1_i2.p1  ORF type:complete len:164 (+),score=14.77 TRINITY_DN5495_c0_g1_i2:74-565(+)